MNQKRIKRGLAVFGSGLFSIVLAVSQGSSMVNAGSARTKVLKGGVEEKKSTSAVLTDALKNKEDMDSSPEVKKTDKASNKEDADIKELAAEVNDLKNGKDYVDLLTNNGSDKVILLWDSYKYLGLEKPDYQDQVKTFFGKKFVSVRAHIGWHQACLVWATRAENAALVKDKKYVFIVPSGEYSLGMDGNSLYYDFSSNNCRIYLPHFYKEVFASRVEKFFKDLSRAEPQGEIFLSEGNERRYRFMFPEEKMPSFARYIGYLRDVPDDAIHYYEKIRGFVYNEREGKFSILLKRKDVDDEAITFLLDHCRFEDFVRFFNRCTGELCEQNSMFGVPKDSANSVRKK